MGELFIPVFNMSYQASIVIVAILLARLVMRLIKAPRKYSYFLWAIPFIRLVCPLTIESVFSLLPGHHSPVSSDIVLMQAPQINVGIQSVNTVINSSLPAAEPYASVNPMQIVIMLVQLAWLGIMMILLLYSLFSYMYFKRRLVCSVAVEKVGKPPCSTSVFESAEEDLGYQFKRKLLSFFGFKSAEADMGYKNVYLADDIQSPFVIGIFRPRIYMPSHLDQEETDYVLKHEKAHIKRGDHIVKFLAFIITCVHWFNPLVWTAYICLCKDMEMACDEKVLVSLDGPERSRYAQVLLRLTVAGTGAGIPLAFGEGNTKSRIKNIMNYKKTAAAAVVTALAITAVLAAGLLTNPSKVDTNNADLRKAIERIPKDAEIVYLAQLVPFRWTEVYTFDPYLDVDRQAAIMGVSGKELESSVNEGMVHFVFVNEGKVVSSVCAYEENLGYSMDIRPVDHRYLSIDYTKITYEENPVFSVKRQEGIIGLTYLSGTSAPAQPEQQVSADGTVAALEAPPSREEVSITAPSIQPGQNLGADGVFLDYAGEGMVIFHGYFGLFVYSLGNDIMVGAVDLAAIGCNATQGDNYCQVSVSADGRTVFLDPFGNDDMYVYEVTEQKLYKTKDYEVSEKLFDSFADIGESIDTRPGFVSEPKVKLGVGGDTYYGYIVSADGTLGTLCYVEGKEEFRLFEGVIEEPITDKLNSGLYGMSVVENTITPSGAVFQMYNNSSGELTYGDSFKLRIQADGNWEDVPYAIDNWGFHQIAYSLKAGTSEDREIKWEWLYGKLAQGRYMLVTDITGEQDGENIIIPLGIEFEIKN